MTLGRITEVHRTNLIVKSDEKEFVATVRGDFHDTGDFPKVGDYVNFSVLRGGKAVIETIEKRKSVIKRKSADSDDEQIIATNVDLIFIVIGLDGDFSISRLERYLLLGKQSGIETVVVLNKKDLVDNLEKYVREVEDVASEVPVVAVSALGDIGMGKLDEYLISGKTAVLLGSSGAGKSTITNWLLQEDKQAVRDIRENDSRGRHTTTSRQLFTLPSGGFIIDTPGMRELGVLENEHDAIDEVFEKINKIAENCKFRNCDHDKSSGCAVLAALESGELSERELGNYHKLQREQAFQESKDSTTASRNHDQNQKRLSQKHAAIQKQKLSRRFK